MAANRGGVHGDRYEEDRNTSPCEARVHSGGLVINFVVLASRTPRALKLRICARRKSDAKRWTKSMALE